MEQEEEQGQGDNLLRALRQRLAEYGLGVVLPLGREAFDAVAARTGAPALTELLPQARSAVVVGDGGPAFFEGFLSARGSSRSPLEPGGAPLSRDPLDDYTRAVVEDAVTAAWSARSGLGLLTWRVLYPFVTARPTLPFQQLGAAAGLPDPGPLAIQIHPRYGPWWAYRALVAVSLTLRTEAPLATSCPGCARPCVAACPAGAVRDTGFRYQPCLVRRRQGAPCDEGCAARVSCPIGVDARYSDQQLAFHMRAAPV